MATEIDFDSTYVGGSEALIQAILGRPELESIQTEIDHAIGYKADQISPPPPRTQQ